MRTVRFIVRREMLLFLVKYNLKGRIIQKKKYIYIKLNKMNT